MSAKVYVFGIDAMEPLLIHEWAQEGALPAFASVLHSGAWGEVINPPRRYNGASWPNFYTGLGPDRHGQYLHTVYDEDSYRYIGQRPKTDLAKAFWCQSAWHDKTIAVVNVPYAPLRPEVKGIQVTNWGVHDYHDHHIQTLPKDLAGEILARFGSDPVGLCEIENRSTEEYCRFRDALVQRVRAKKDMLCHYLESRDWDLFVSVLDETHCVGHQAWHFLEPDHPRYDAEMARTVGNPIKDVYREIDSALASVLARLDDQSTLLVLSSHGMGPNSGEKLVLDEILRRFEGVDTGQGAQGIETVKKWLGAMPSWAQSMVRPLRDRYAWSINEVVRTRDRKSRRYFSIETHDPTSGVRINLAGREADGRVQPGEEYEEVIQHLIKEFSQLVDGESGKPLVERIVRREEIDYTGYLGAPPDLVIDWAIRAPVSIESPTIGRLEPLYNSRLGDHRMAGLFAAVGPTVRPGHLNAAVHLEDFAPTISKILDLPAGMTEGTPIAQMMPRSLVH